MDTRLYGADDRLVEWGTRLLGEARAPLVVTSVRRSAAFQRHLYARYLAGANPFPVAPPGFSAHEYGLAFDVVGPLAELRRLGALWRSWGGRWGGGVDPIHFELGPRMRMMIVTANPVRVTARSTRCRGPRLQLEPRAAGSPAMEGGRGRHRRRS